MIKQFKKKRRNTGKVIPMTLKQKITKLCRGIIEFNKGYKVRSNLEKDENVGRLADFYSILNCVRVT
jgi:hypothetical protein